MLLRNIMSKDKSVQIEEIDINKIQSDPNQPRKSFHGLEELASTIKQHGLQSPIQVRKVDDGYMIVSGERRWRACKYHTDMVSISCIVVDDLDETKVRYIQLIENLQREDLTPIEEAEFYRSILELGEISQRELAKEIGVREDSISKTLRLTTLPKIIKEELRDHPDIPKSFLLEIAKEDEDFELQLEIWEKIKSGELTKRDEVVHERKKVGTMNSLSLNWEEIDANEVWSQIQQAVEQDRNILKKLLNVRQYEKLILKSSKSNDNSC